MKYFLDETGGVHALSDADLLNGGADLLPAGVAEISEHEAIAATMPPPLTGNALLLEQIETLERKVTPRREREAILGIDGGWMAALNTEVATLRNRLT